MDTEQDLVTCCFTSQKEANPDPPSEARTLGPGEPDPLLLFPDLLESKAAGPTGSQLTGFLSPPILLQERPAVGVRLMATIKGKMPLQWPAVLPHLGAWRLSSQH